MKAIIFARVSTKDQEEGHSLDAQINQALSYAIDNDLQIIKQFKIIESSTKGKRPEFKQMVDFIRTQKQKIVVIAYNIDRLQRDFDEQALLLHALVKEDRAEIHFTSTRQKVTSKADSSTKFRYGLDVLLARDYANRISDNVKRSIKKKLEEGTILGDSPLGYLNRPRVDKKKEKSCVEFDPNRHHLVKRMFEDYATGLYSLEEIRRRITNEGLRTKKNQKLAKSQVENILTNPFYCGFMRKKTGEMFPHIYPKLITQNLFYKCQDVKNGKSIKRHRRTLIPFTLRGMLTCKHCNCVYSPELKKEKYVYMRPTKSQGDCAYCFNIKEEVILGQIEDIIKSIHIPENILTQIKDHLKHLVSKQYTMQKSEIRKLEEQLQVSNERLKSMRLKFVDNIITAEEHALWSKEETDNKLSIEEKIQTLRLVDNDFEKEVIQMLELANRSHELFKSSDVDQKRQIISLLLPNLF